MLGSLPQTLNVNGNEYRISTDLSEDEKRAKAIDAALIDLQAQAD